MPPTEPAPYQPTVADIERRDDAGRKQHDAFIDELRAVTQKARAEGRDRERERVERLAARRLAPILASAAVHPTWCADIELFLAAVRTGKDPGR